MNEQCTWKKIRDEIEIPSYKKYCERFSLEYKPETIMSSCRDVNCNGQDLECNLYIPYHFAEKKIGLRI